MRPDRRGQGARCGSEVDRRRVLLGCRAGSGDRDDPGGVDGLKDEMQYQVEADVDRDGDRPDGLPPQIYMRAPPDRDRGGDDAEDRADILGPGPGCGRDCQERHAAPPLLRGSGREN